MNNTESQPTRWIESKAKAVLELAHVEAGNPEVKIGVNLAYALDALKLMPEQCAYRFSAPDKCMEFSCENWRYLLMPLRI